MLWIALIAFLHVDGYYGVHPTAAQLQGEHQYHLREQIMFFSGIATIVVATVFVGLRLGRPSNVPH